MEIEVWDFHEMGNASCEACAVPPVPHDECGGGLIHTQFDAALVAVEGRCDYCQAHVQFSEVEEGVSCG